MKNGQKREQKKPRTAEDKGKRYRCAVCRKKSPKKTKIVPYYCDVHRPKEEA